MLGRSKLIAIDKRKVLGPSHDLVSLLDANGGPFGKEGRSPRKESVSEISFFD